MLRKQCHLLLFVSFFLVLATAEVVAQAVTDSTSFNFEEVLAKFKDVPDAHWAEGAVYEMSRLGVLQGYPDGTFQGSRNITRYETAKIAAAMIAYLRETYVYDDRAVVALNAELEVLKERWRAEEAARRKREAEARRLRGTFTSQLRAANPVDSGKQKGHGVRADYRLQLSSNPYEHVIVSLDTMDAGFEGGESDLTRKLFDVVVFWDSDWGMWTVTAGPGDVSHSSDSLLPIESGRVYRRLWQSALLESEWWHWNRPITIRNRYLARRVDGLSGVTVHQYTLWVGFPLGDGWLSDQEVGGAIDWYGTGLSSGGSRDVRGTLFGSGRHGKWLGEAQLGIADTKSASGLMALVSLIYDPDLEAGTRVAFRAVKVGRRYLSASLGEVIEQEGVQALNYFDRPFAVGTVDIGVSVDQELSKKVEAFVKGDYVTDGSLRYSREAGTSEAMVEMGFRYHPEDQAASVELAYQAYQQPSNTAAPTSESIRLAFQQAF